MSTIYVVDIVLLVILYILIMFMCGYSVFCVYRLVRTMQMRILLRPTRVVFSSRKEGDSTEELRTVVAYQNPLTGDYCVHKSREPKGYMNAIPHGYQNPAGASPDSGLSDEYEPLHLEDVPLPRDLHDFENELQRLEQSCMPEGEIVKPHNKISLNDNSVNKTWNWNYKEYQI